MNTRSRTKSYVWRFPVEICRTVFEIAADGDMHALLDLQMVSREVRSWVEPKLYEAIWIDFSVIDLVRITFKMKPRSFFATHVKALCFSYIDVGPEWIPFLEACEGVTNFAFWPKRFKTLGNDLRVELGKMKLDRLSIDLSEIVDDCAEIGPNNPFPLDIFETITHLDCTHEENLDWGGFSRIPYLTHLGFLCWQERPDFARKIRLILETCASIKYLVLSLRTDSPFTDQNKADIEKLDDLRVAVFVVGEDDAEDWLHGVRGEVAYWTRAEERVAEQLEKKKQIFPRIRPA